MKSSLRRWIKVGFVCGLLFISISCTPKFDGPAVPTAPATVPPIITAAATITESEPGQLETESIDPGATEPTDHAEDVEQSSGRTSIDVESTSESDEAFLGAEVDTLVPTYRVNFIEEDDTLNIRSGPGVDSPIVGEVPIATAGIKVTGQGQWVGNSLWLPVEYDSIHGWINSRYLAEEMNTERFCNSEDSQQIVDNLLLGIRSQDGDVVADLVEEGRVLRIRRHWWNPEVRLERDVLSDLFLGEESYGWGIADGSGEVITGSFTEIISPIMERNLLGATEIGCGVILHGGTAGYVRLPSSYEGINFYSLYRPAEPDEFELDWGTWVVGIEKWQGEYRLSFLIHYEWEI